MINVNCEHHKIYNHFGYRPQGMIKGDYLNWINWIEKTYPLFVALFYELGTRTMWTEESHRRTSIHCSLLSLLTQVYQVSQLHVLRLPYYDELYHWIMRQKFPCLLSFFDQIFLSHKEINLDRKLILGVGFLLEKKTRCGSLDFGTILWLEYKRVWEGGL